mmetsp:Transcript_11593/g.22810  ORF Transcript_11593/g.22810 Transcript_11593/m.22810 type:complete len:513 (+) Transcript_11593:525-2063(+)|eukprot:CAMPEP_0171510588 /NCGR_PEP_ID=MMETSP0959-20130129/465_1 /TAXON_ID=87120 /ORGANISM="Aurantiochytrium limacinum, Strain ATCCMYA-1381" /LENGTH=512 /DNA_ID=CAMNT_0012048005 /DNA_START=422 /DNA_END=1960 /DNA_ORIENTATION=-
MTSALDLLWTSVKAILPVFLILACGVFGVRKGVFDQRTGAMLSWLVKFVFVPSLMFIRLGEGLSQELFAEVWILMVMGLVVLLINWVLGAMLVPIAKPTRSFRVWFIYSMTFPNITALPLAFIGAVCAGSKIRRPARTAILGTVEGEFYTATECVEVGELYLFIYIIFPNVLIFAAPTMLNAFYKPEPEAVDQGIQDQFHSNEDEIEPQRSESLSNPKSQISSGLTDVDDSEANYGDVELALPAPETQSPEAKNKQIPGSDLQNKDPTCAMADSGSSFSTSSEDIAHDGSQNETREVQIESIEQLPNQAVSEASGKETRNLGRIWGQILIDTVVQPAVSGQIIAIIISLIPPLQSFVFSSNSFATPFISVLRLFAPGLVSIITLALSIILGTKLLKTKYKDLWGGNEADTGFSKRTLLFFVLGRTIILPGIEFGLLYAALDIFPNDQMLLIILFFEAFVPTGNMCAICAPPAQGQIISLGMINQYLVGILTMTFWCFLTLSITTAVTDPYSV